MTKRAADSLSTAGRCGQAFLFALILSTSATAFAGDAAPLDRFTWQHRLLLVFTPGETHADYRRQQAILEHAGPGLADRDLRVLRVNPSQTVTVDGSAAADLQAAALYHAFGIDPSAFAAILVGKDGTRKLARTKAVEAREVFDLIDSMPMRQWEMQQRNS